MKKDMTDNFMWQYERKNIAVEILVMTTKEELDDWLIVKSTKMIMNDYIQAGTSLCSNKRAWVFL